MKKVDQLLLKEDLPTYTELVYALRLAVLNCPVKGPAVKIRDRLYHRI